MNSEPPAVANVSWLRVGLLVVGVLMLIPLMAMGLMPFLFGLLFLVLAAFAK